MRPTFLFLLLTLNAFAQPAPRYVMSAPAGSAYTKIDKAGRTVLPNGRFITPRGRQIQTAPHPYGLALSPDRDCGDAAFRPSTRLKSLPGTVDDRVQVARDRENKFVVAYITDGHPITLDLSGMSSKRFSGYWFDPRTGGRQIINQLSRQSERQFTPPTSGPEQDWVLVVTNRK